MTDFLVFISFMFLEGNKFAYAQDLFLTLHSGTPVWVLETVCDVGHWTWSNYVLMKDSVYCTISLALLLFLIELIYTVFRVISLCLPLSTGTLCFLKPLPIHLATLVMHLKCLFVFKPLKFLFNLKCAVMLLRQNNPRYFEGHFIDTNFKCWSGDSFA